MNNQNDIQLFNRLMQLDEIGSENWTNEQAMEYFETREAWGALAFPSTANTTT